MWPPGQRFCYTCNQLFDVAYFGRSKIGTGGYTSACKACRKIKSKKDFARQSHEYKIYYRAKGRAKKEDVPFDIELGDIIIPEICPVFGVPFIYGHHDWTASIDRLEPSLGYVKGNVYIISNRANRLKNDATLDELAKIFAYVQKRTETEIIQ